MGTTDARTGARWPPASGEEGCPPFDARITGAWVACTTGRMTGLTLEATTVAEAEEEAEAIEDALAVRCTPIASDTTGPPPARADGRAIALQGRPSMPAT